jgi:hypothetical protein
LGLGGKIKTKKNTRNPEKVRKDEFADLNFGNPIKQSKKKDDNFDFGFADFNNNKKSGRKNDLDFGFGRAKQGSNPLNINSRLGQKSRGRGQQELLQFKKGPQEIKKDVDLLDFDIPPQRRAPPKPKNDDFDFL